MCAKIHQPWSTFQLPNYTTRTFSFLLKCCDPNANDDVVGEDTWEILWDKILQRPKYEPFQKRSNTMGGWSWCGIMIVLFGFLGMMSATIHEIGIYKSLEPRNWNPNKIEPLSLEFMVTFWAGQADGDPHIHSLRGAHYTLLSQGNFVAWSYSKGTGETEAELFASYAGSRFTTQALALKIKGSKAEMLEITAQDCQWRAKSSGQWVEAESKDFSESNLEVEPPIKGQGRLYMHTSILLNKLAKVMTRCKPGAHLDFKVEMLHKQDLQYVGGQLGAAPDEQKTRILSSGLTRLKTDSKFQAGLGVWLHHVASCCIMLHHVASM